MAGGRFLIRSRLVQTGTVSFMWLPQGLELKMLHLYWILRSKDLDPKSKTAQLSPSYIYTPATTKSRNSWQRAPGIHAQIHTILPST